MTTILLPCDGSPDALLAVLHAADAFRRGDVTKVHLLNVQPPFSANVARHASQDLRADFHRERADEALGEARQLLEAAGVPHHVHTEVGDKVRCIADAARRPARWHSGRPGRQHDLAVGGCIVNAHDRCPGARPLRVATLP